MYEAFFGLSRAPFTREIAPSELFASRQHKELLQRLRYAAERRMVMLLTGEVGSGKSTALRALREHLDSARYEILYLADVAFSPRSFFHRLLEELHAEAPYQLTRAKRLAYRTLLERHQTQHRTPVLVVDEAQHLSRAVLEEVRGLLNYDCDAFVCIPAKPSTRFGRSRPRVSVDVGHAVRLMASTCFGVPRPP